MRIHLAVYYKCNEHRVKQAGEFLVDRQSYNIDDVQEAIRAAGVFIRQIKNSLSCRVELLKVVYNNSVGITEHLK